MKFVNFHSIDFVPAAFQFFLMGEFTWPTPHRMYSVNSFTSSGAVIWCVSDIWE